LIVEMLEVTILGLMVIEIFVIILIQADFCIFYSFFLFFQAVQCAMNSRKHPIKI